MAGLFCLHAHKRYVSLCFEYPTTCAKTGSPVERMNITFLPGVNMVVLSSSVSAKVSKMSCQEYKGYKWSTLRTHKGRTAVTNPHPAAIDTPTPIPREGQPSLETKKKVTKGPTMPRQKDGWKLVLARKEPMAPADQPSFCLGIRAPGVPQHV